MIIKTLATITGISRWRKLWNNLYFAWGNKLKWLNTKNDIKNLVITNKKSLRGPYNIFERSSRPETFYKKGVLENFANFTGK